MTEVASIKIGRSVADRLRDRILGGELVPGQRLVEAEFMREYDVGRSAVRDAFMQLESDGLVELKHQRGARVVRLNRVEIADLFGVREQLEGYAARLAADRVDEAGHRDWLLAQKAIWEGKDVLYNERTHMDKNMPLHEGIIQMSGNKCLVETLKRLHIPVYRKRFLDQLVVERREQSIADHLSIIDMLLRGNAAESENQMRQHVRRTGLLAQEIEGLEGAK
ncbi:hypothetical protein CD351_08220 [Erythrobacter sp. KY5]|nr:hypothetical protein CD351_08220 [Erythrobacter sp. KY5]